MSQYLLPAVLLSLAAIIAFFALRLLWSKSWLLGTLRGLAGLSLLMSVAVLALSAKDLLSYRHLSQQQTIANISFTGNLDGSYQVEITPTDVESSASTYKLWGDQWQIDARVIRWVAEIPMTPVYRLERLSGRYYSIEDEATAPRSLYSLADTNYGVDIWQWINFNAHYLPYIDAVYGSATYLPAKDGALFELKLSNSGLFAKPLNQHATEAIQNWQ
ncbi:hypothetical protein SIN8267_00376 [Sinobacterium norvegicum]|uniref:Cation/multidrug efflux pump n=1 Tax=Sinobacterium norvegicum TaxID=1641715 RepID=A0ABM9ABC0_9GAMM|nr:cation/multidrug efflux pump [Sinobacterium norvegicum]CAH0990284.1 hypothetical protein SIN8267_00376 [Sinobacterium norvegicum]